jgi:hypothetical protein
MSDLTLDQVRELDRMAHHDEADGAEFWWGPNGGLRIYFATMPDAIDPPHPHPYIGDRFKRRDVVLHLSAQTNTVRFPVIDATPLGEPALPPALSLRTWTLDVPKDGWAHMRGCDCEFCHER